MWSHLSLQVSAEIASLILTPASRLPCLIQDPFNDNWNPGLDLLSTPKVPKSSISTMRCAGSAAKLESQTSSRRLQIESRWIGRQRMLVSPQHCAVMNRTGMIPSEKECLISRSGFPGNS